MFASWGKYLGLIGYLALLAGCRTPQPNLKPDRPPEQLTLPTNEARYDTSEYPKAAFDKLDPKGSSLDRAGGGGGPGKGGMGGGGMNGR